MGNISPTMLQLIERAMIIVIGSDYVYVPSPQTPLSPVHSPVRPRAHASIPDRRLIIAKLYIIKFWRLYLINATRMLDRYLDGQIDWQLESSTSIRHGRIRWKIAPLWSIGVLILLFSLLLILREVVRSVVYILQNDLSKSCNCHVIICISVKDKRNALVCSLIWTAKSWAFSAEVQSEER